MAKQKKETPKIIEAILKALGGTDTKSKESTKANIAYAQFVSGTTNKKDKAYMSARRNIQRYKQGTSKPSKKAQEALKNVFKQTTKLKVQFQGRTQFSAKPNNQRVTFDQSSGGRKYIEGDLALEFLELYNNGQDVAAVELLFDSQYCPGLQVIQVNNLTFQYV